MAGRVIEIACPCCGAKIEADAESATVLGHTPQSSRTAPKDLEKAILEVRQEEGQREERFRERIAQEARREGDLDRKFASLLKKQRGRKSEGRPLRDFDLD